METFRRSWFYGMLVKMNVVPD